MRVEFIAGESWKIWKNYRSNRPVYLVQLFLDANRGNRQFASTQGDASRRRLSDRLNRPTSRPEANATRGRMRVIYEVCMSRVHVDKC